MRQVGQQFQFKRTVTNETKYEYERILCRQIELSSMGDENNIN